MTTREYQLKSNLTFYYRLVVFLAAPALFLYTSPASLTIIASALLAAAFGVDFFTGRTTWLAVRPIPILTGLLFTSLLGIYLFTDNQVSLATLLCPVLLLLALSSDMIADSSRWKIIVPVSLFACLMVDLLLYEIPNKNVAWAFPATGFLAALVRLSFPRTKHLIHTSLDYRFARIELLSFGMKKLVAIGVKKI